MALKTKVRQKLDAIRNILSQISLSVWKLPYVGCYHSFLMAFYGYISWEFVDHIYLLHWRLYGSHQKLSLIQI